MPKAVNSTHCYAFLTVALWSSAYVFTKIALQSFSAAPLGFLRCAVAAVILAACMAFRKTPLPQRRDLPLLALAGILGFAVYLLVFNEGLKTLNPTTSCILIATSPIITALIARAWFRERLTRAGWCAVVLAFCGVVVLMLWDGTLVLSRGVFWMLCASLSISGYSILQRKLSQRYSALQITTYSFIAGAALLAWCLPETARQVQSAPLSQLGVVLFLGVFPSALAYLSWTKALACAARTSTVTNYMYLTPFLALLLEYLIIAEIPGPGTFVGGAVILGSLLLFAKAGKETG